MKGTPASFIGTIKFLLRESLYVLMYGASFCIPKDRRIWLFGARLGLGYEDNSRFLFEYVSAKGSDVRSIWITRSNDIYHQLKDHGNEVYLANSPKAYWLGCRAKVIIGTHNPHLDTVPCAGAGSKIVQLWHGSPLKKILFDDHEFSSRWGYIFKRISHYFVPHRRLSRLDIIISASEQVSKSLTTSFKIRPEKVKITGYPRNDILLSEKPTCEEEYVEALQSIYGSPKIIAYLPTYHYEHDGTYGFDLKPFMDTLEGIEDLLKETESVFVLRFHPFIEREVRNMVNPVKLYEKEKLAIEALSSNSRVILGNTKGGDFYPILKHADMLITDYSSVFFDFLLLNKPIIFYRGANEIQYEDNIGLYYEYEKVAAGPITKNWAEALEQVRVLLDNPRLYEDRRKAIKEIFNKYSDARSCERVYNEIMKLVGTDSKDRSTLRSRWFPS